MIKKKMDKNGESGNALIYVLIAIVLFAALGFTLSRQASTTGTDEIDDAKAEILAMELMTYSAQVKSVIDQMMFTGSDIDELDFTLPSEGGFNTAPHIHKIYHPQGGGLTPSTLSDKAINQISTPPSAGWYLGRFNTVEWTLTTGSDVILTAHQIKKPICEKINKNLTGAITIPALAGNLEDFLVDSATDTDFDIADCAACEGYSTLCVSNSGATTYSFYTIVAER